MEHRIEFVFTFFGHAPIIEDCPLEIEYLDNEQALKEYAISSLTEEEKKSLFNITCNILFIESDNTPIDIPKWYKECDGILWFRPELVTI